MQHSWFYKHLLSFGVHVLSTFVFFSDNTTAGACMNKMGSIKVQCNAITRNL